MFDGTELVLNGESVSSNTFTNPSKLYQCEIPTVITETLIAYKPVYLFFLNCERFYSLINNFGLVCDFIERG
jgi:hypothetical protein